MRYDVVVVGGGVVGHSTARAVARRGRSVLLLEQFELGHDRGSSHGSVRAFAFAHSQPELVDESVEAYAMWRELEQERGVELITTTGSGLRVAQLDGIAARLEANGISYEILDHEQIAARHDIHLDAGEDRIIFTHEGGTINAARALVALRDSALAAGAQIAGGARVAAIEPGADGVTVICEDGARHEAGVAVVAAGAWASRLLAPLGIALETEVTRQTIAYYPFTGDGLYPCIYEDGEPPVYWVSAPGEGLKIGEALHGHGEQTVDPDVHAAPDPADVARITAYVARHFPRVTPVPSRAETCLVTETDDRVYRLQRHGDVVYAAACCGRGFKLAPRTGTVLADLACSTDAAATAAAR